MPQVPDDEPPLMSHPRRFASAGLSAVPPSGSASATFAGLPCLKPPLQAPPGFCRRCLLCGESPPRPTPTASRLHRPRCSLELLIMMLSNLKAIAEDNLKSAVVDCCIGMPVFFTDRQHRAILDATNIAGFHLLRLFHKTTTTALAYVTHKWIDTCAYVLVDESSPLTPELLDAIITKYVPTLTLDGMDIKMVENKLMENFLAGHTFILGSSEKYKFGEKIQELLESTGAKYLIIDEFCANSQAPKF